MNTIFSMKPVVSPPIQNNYRARPLLAKCRFVFICLESQEKEEYEPIPVLNDDKRALGQRELVLHLVSGLKMMCFSCH